MASLPSADQARLVAIGGRRATLLHPEALAPWFARLPLADGAACEGDWIAIGAGEAESWAVETSGGERAVAPGVGDAMALVWDRLAHALVVDLAAAFALHGAALSNEDGLLLLSGSSGSGKTRLSLWLSQRGFSLGTDELVALLPAREPPAICAVDCLPRPLILKDVRTAAGLVAESGPVLLETPSASGLLLEPQHRRAWTSKDFDRVAVVFPRFREGAALELAALSPAQTGLQLLGNCINVRNLPQGGLALASRLGRAVRAVALTYGSSDQLDGVVDVVARLMLAARPDHADLAALCRAFSAMGTVGPSGSAESRASVRVDPPSTFPAPTLARYPRRITVGMTTYDDYDGAYFSIQALRAYHPELADDLEVLVIDNNPGGKCAAALKQLADAVPGCRYTPRGEWSGTAMKNAVFEEASSPIVMCIDSHVLIMPGALSRLLPLLETELSEKDLLQGPLLLDDQRQVYTHLDPKWQGGMYGVWSCDRRGSDPTGPAFEIPMQGMGLFACRRASWVGFHSGFRGFGAEEGYIHEKVRQRGGRTLCLPVLRWVHRFGRPLGVPYVNRWEDRIRNYLIGWHELRLDTTAMEAHFDELLGEAVSRRLFTEARRELGLDA